MYVHTRSRIFHNVTLPSGWNAVFPSWWKLGTTPSPFSTESMRPSERSQPLFSLLPSLLLPLFFPFFSLSSLWKLASFHVIVRSHTCLTFSRLIDEHAMRWVGQRFFWGCSRRECLFDRKKQEVRETMHPRFDDIYMVVLVDRLWTSRHEFSRRDGF